MRVSDEGNAVWVRYQDTPHILTSECYDDHDERELPIRYCPFCGKKLSDLK